MSALSATSRYSTACTRCRAKKIRCDGGHPCSRCVNRRVECVASEARRRKREDARNGTVGEQLGRTENSVQKLSKDTQNASQSTEYLAEHRLSERITLTPSLVTHQHYEASRFMSHSPEQPEPSPNQPNTLVGEACVSEQIDIWHPRSRAPESAINAIGGVRGTEDASPDISHIVIPTNGTSVPAMLDNGATEPLGDIRHAHKSNPTLMSIPGGGATTTPPDRNGTSDTSVETGSWEYLGEELRKFDALQKISQFPGPRSFLSICSQPGVRWIAEHAKPFVSKEFIFRLARDITSRLQMEVELSRQRAPDPSEETALEYTREFFDHAWEANAGIIDRSWFERQLQHHLSGGSVDDNAWYALRNTIFAFGCRIRTSKNASFTEATTTSWPFFENALSSQATLIYVRPTLTSVRTLALMAYYTEGIGSPHLQYMLISEAMRLATSKGLHRQPSVSWKLTPEAINSRCWLFWAIYSLDRQIASRSGRPPCIDESQVSCTIPSTSPTNDAAHLAYFRVYHGLCQLLSRALDTLSSAPGLQKSAAKLADTVSDLQAKLAEFKQSIWHIVELDGPFEENHSSGGFGLEQAIRLQHLYFLLQLEIHTKLAFPWYHDATVAKELLSWRARVDRSCVVVAQTAREIILMSRLVRIDASSAVGSVIFLPLYAIIALFVNILKTPAAKEANSDLALMSVGTGYFSRLQFETNMLFEYSFTQEATEIARSVVDRSKTSQDDASNVYVASSAETNLGNSRPADVEESLQYSHGMTENQSRYQPNFELDTEILSTLFPGSEDAFDFESFFWPNK